MTTFLIPNVDKIYDDPLEECNAASVSADAE
jgi:hypothetical protein